LILEHSKGALLHFDRHIVTFLRICRILDFADFRVYLHVLSLALFTWINRAEKPFFESGGSSDDPFMLDISQPKPSTLEQTFPDGLDSIAGISFPDSMNLQLIFQSDPILTSNLECVIEILSLSQDCATEFLTNFSRVLTVEFQSAHNYDYWTLFVILYHKSGFRSNVCVNLLSTRVLFDPRFTIFGKLSDI
jgi:hypothetical protein